MYLLCTTTNCFRVIAVTTCMQTKQANKTNIEADVCGIQTRTPCISVRHAVSVLLSNGFSAV